MSASPEQSDDFALLLRLAAKLTAATGPLSHENRRDAWAKLIEQADNRLTAEEAGVLAVAAERASDAQGHSQLASRPDVDLARQSEAPQHMNLYYLQLQEAMAAENRAFTAASNVLKARHDTVKNAIQNIR